ncbi:EscI/YscI/HrpB family type III secretion system inner rod protein [Acerihabitans arboris]|uniref:AraC family transcriptional regulator n=1 Tax=Acerihabitans arboris TaxID=2691583 RepID=A0A845SEZ3_9GAMM|nr:EscI/YscI/HrpB family type III secretion system inner rod protein [Acerihabitans arboris]NDL63370.1 AraC family transcriptional regulator [Acerihabitans arboris]
MKMTEIPQTATPPAITGDAGLPHQPGQADIQWFAAELNRADSSTGAPSAQGFIPELAAALKRGGQRRKNAFDDLQKASRSTNILVLNQATESLSDAYVETLMNAKIVSKAVQSIDKLTNLQ